MSLDVALDAYPKEVRLKGDFCCVLRPLEFGDELSFHEFFLAVPRQEFLFLKHRVTEPDVIHGWCTHIDYGRNLPLLAVQEGRTIACGTLHQQLGGWKRHIGRLSVLVHPSYRGRGLATRLVTEMIDISRQVGLERVEAEFIGEQEAALRLFGLMGFTPLARLDDYVKDMDGHTHDYVLMGLVLKTDEEFTGMG